MGSSLNHCSETVLELRIMNREREAREHTWVSQTRGCFLKNTNSVNVCWKEVLETAVFDPYASAMQPAESYRQAHSSRS